MHGVASDLRLVWRQFRKSPGFAITAVLMLAFGIGATTAIFSVVDGELLRPLPFPQANELVTLGDQASGRLMGKRDPGWVTAPELVTYQREQTRYVPRGPDKSNRSIVAPFQLVGDYFRAMGIPLLRGRYFTAADNANSQLVAIVNHEFAEYYWPQQDPIGKHLRVGSLKMPTLWMTVVGEVADARLGPPDQDARVQFYQPVAQEVKEFGGLAPPTALSGNSDFIVVRSALPPDQMENTMRGVVRELDPQLPLSQVQTMDEVVAQSEGPRRFNTTVVTSFALAAVLLAGLGIYSIVAFSVASRVQEMAIRVALGSQRVDILRLVLISGVKLAAVGVLIGLAGAAAASRLVRSFLFEVSPFDPAVLVLAAIVVFALALAASTIPARRAASVDPMEALRGE